MVVGAKVCELTDGFLWFVCGLYVGILTSTLRGDVKIQVAATATVCSCLQRVATLLCQFKPI